MRSRPGLLQMFFGVVAALFFAVPAVANVLVVTGYLEAAPFVRAVSVFGALASFTAVAVAA